MNRWKELMYGTNDTKNQILDILSTNYPLSAKKIFYAMKKIFSSPITYQGVHKTLKELVEQKVLVIEDREYKINVDWLHNMQQHISNVSNYINAADKIMSIEDNNNPMNMINEYYNSIIELTKKYKGEIDDDEIFLSKANLDKSLDIKELASKDIMISKGNYIQLMNKVDMAMWPSKEWAMSFQQIAKEKDEEYLYERGIEFGKDSAEEIYEAIIKQKVPHEFHLIENIIEFSGFGIIKVIEYEPKKKIKIKIEYNHIINYGLEFYGKKSMVVSFYRGVYESFIKVFLDFKRCRLVDKGDNILENEE